MPPEAAKRGLEVDPKVAVAYVVLARGNCPRNVSF